MKKEIKDEEYYVQKFMEDEDEIDLFEIFRKLWMNKRVITLFLIIGTTISFIGARIYKSSSSVTRVGISFNFEEIKQGKNPDGTPFNSNKILSNKALKNMYDNYKEITKKSINLTDFRSYIKISPVIPKNITTLIEKNLKDGVFYSFTPTEYFINLKTDMTNEQEKEFLEKSIKNIIDEYLLKNRPFSQIPTIDIKKLENENFIYEDYLEVIKLSIAMIENDIKTSEIKKLKYNSSALNYDFNDILVALDVLKKIVLNEVEAKLGLRYISSNIEKSTALLNQTLINLDIENQILKRKAEVLSEMIKNYKISSKELILPDGMNATLPEKDEYYSKLISDYVETTTKIEENTQISKQTQKKLLELSKSSETENNEVIEGIKNLIKLVNIEISRFNELNKKYYEAEYSDMLTQITPVENVYTGKPWILFVIVGAFASFLAGCGYVLIKESIKTKKEEK